MVNVTGVRFKNTGKVYYFDPADLEVKLGQGVIVETARGLEYGTVTMASTEMKEEDLSKPLKPIVRIADEEDIRRHEENEKRKGHAMEICQEKIRKHNLEMKLIDVEYTFDNNKIVFYFTADGRVDFRDLVKDLASVFKMRIELRQIGVRDEAKMLGGVGSCGRGLCCATWLSDFEPVSIKMAKTQNLSLNPTKISGVCGRLMCCLKYENDVYKELRKDIPDVGERVETPEGLGKVVDSDVIAGRVRVRIYTGEKEENGADKLGSDFYTFNKDEVTRIEKKDRGKGGQSQKSAKAQGSREQKQKNMRHARDNADKQEQNGSVQEDSPARIDEEEAGKSRRRPRRSRRGKGKPKNDMQS